jgi:hypothetical protein
VGRAEDQAFILSALFSESGASLRYLHKPGLIMRHDKEAFAAESIKAATHGRFIGDLARTYIYTAYAAALPWGVERTKEEIDPFTGCFVSHVPLSVILLRLLLMCVAMHSDRSESDTSIDTVLDLADRKLSPLIAARGDETVPARYKRERGAWNEYYDALERAEARGGADLANRVQSILSDSRIV